MKSTDLPDDIWFVYLNLILLKVQYHVLKVISGRSGSLWPSVQALFWWPLACGIFLYRNQTCNGSVLNHWTTRKLSAALFREQNLLGDLLTDLGVWGAQNSSPSLLLP